ncbi:double-stranded DNA-binding domain-containing protein [Xylariomycetidae sp. FL2044]|nr:double-stranded DNA-binding domain-containing protein [Xylariomycetidae sp. FL2044]
MADAELEAIRKARLEQLKAQSGGASGGGARQGPGQDHGEQQKQQEAEARQSILNQIAHPDALDRLGRIRLVNEARAAEVEDQLIAQARMGRLRQKVTDAELQQLLKAFAERRAAQETEKITISRRTHWPGEDDDDDLLDL